MLQITKVSHVDYVKHCIFISTFIASSGVADLSEAKISSVSFTTASTDSVFAHKDNKYSVDI